MTQLHRVLYCSRNLIPGTPEEVAADVHSILATSRRNNARDGITGGLLFSEGCFAQVLEGPLDAVESAFERIQCDERHSDVTVLQSGPVATRNFPDWSMGFAGPDAATGPIEGTRMADAFAGRSKDGDKLLDVLKSVIVREAEWLAPASEMATALG